MDKSKDKYNQLLYLFLHVLLYSWQVVASGIHWQPWSVVSFLLFFCLPDWVCICFDFQI